VYRHFPRTISSPCLRRTYTSFAHQFPQTTAFLYACYTFLGLLFDVLSWLSHVSRVQATYCAAFKRNKPLESFLTTHIRTCCPVTILGNVRGEGETLYNIVSIGLQLHVLSIRCMITVLLYFFDVHMRI